MSDEIMARLYTAYIFPDPCPTGVHKGGFCCHACDHDYPVSCCCGDVEDAITFLGEAHSQKEQP